MSDSSSGLIGCGRGSWLTAANSSFDGTMSEFPPSNFRIQTVTVASSDVTIEDIRKDKKIPCGAEIIPSISKRD